MFGPLTFRKQCVVSPRPLELKVRTGLDVEHGTGRGTNNFLSLFSVVSEARVFLCWIHEATLHERLLSVAEVASLPQQAAF